MENNFDRMAELLAQMNDKNLEVRYSKITPHYLSLCKDGWLVAKGETPSLQRVAYIQTAPLYGAVAKELQAALVTAETIRVLSRDPAIKKLSAASREALETALAGIE